MAGNTQVSLPRDLVRELAPDLTEADDAIIERLFGNPPRVLFQLYGNPPQAILVWPVTNQAQAYQEYLDQQADEESAQLKQSSGAKRQRKITAKNDD